MACNCNKQPQQLTLGKVVHGAVGIAKSVLHIARAPEAAIQARRDICRICEFATKNAGAAYKQFNGLTNTSVCTQCKCVIALKTNNKDEACPLNLWSKVQ